MSALPMFQPLEGWKMKKFKYFLVLVLLSSFLSGCWIWVPGPDIVRPGNLPPGKMKGHGGGRGD
jgi:hypothetical protein